MQKNKTASIEWLTHAYHDLDGAMLLFKANHYTDTTSYVLQQAIEKMLKAILAAQNKPIKKIHNLLEVYDLVMSDSFTLDEDDLMYLSIATAYYIKQKYPTPHKRLPSKEEIEEIIQFSNRIFNRICILLDIDPDKII